MKKVMLILMLGVFTLGSSGFAESKTHLSSHVDCISVSNAVYDAVYVFTGGNNGAASAGADAAYDSCVEQGGHPGDSVANPR